MEIKELEDMIAVIKRLIQDDKLKVTGKTLPFLRKELALYQELLKYKIAVRWFKDNGFADIVKNLTDY